MTYRIYYDSVLAANVRAARGKRSLDEMGRRAGLSAIIISQIERGVRDPFVGELARLAHAGCTTTAALVKGIDAEVTKEK